MTDAFEKIAEAYELSQGGPVAGQKQRRRLYALYQQATEGDAKGKQPGFFNFHDQAKFQAWKKFAGMPRDEAKQKFVELAQQLGYRDPEDCPVAWISDETWRREESWVNPEMDDRFPCVNTPELVVVDEEDRRIAPRKGADSETPPPAGDEQEHLSRLTDAPETRAFHLYEPKWPVCERRLTVLVGYRGVDHRFESLVSETHRVDQERQDDSWKELMDTDEPQPYGEETLRDGLLLFHCRNCGGLYLSSHDV